MFKLFRGGICFVELFLYLLKHFGVFSPSFVWLLTTFDFEFKLCVWASLAFGLRLIRIECPHGFLWVSIFGRVEG